VGWIVLVFVIALYAAAVGYLRVLPAFWQNALLYIAIALLAILLIGRGGVNRVDYPCIETREYSTC